MRSFFRCLYKLDCGASDGGTLGNGVHAVLDRLAGHVLSAFARHGLHVERHLKS